MTDQEKSELELSLALIDQAIASEKATKSTKDLTDAVDIETDASLNLTDSKEKVIDKMSDLEYSLTEQNRVEKRYLNQLSNRLDIEKKIGLVDYSQIDKSIHEKIVQELEKRLKEEQEKNKHQEKDNEETEEVEQKRKKSERDYLKEAEKMHKKQISVFKRITDGHKSYMQNSSSLVGRVLMGALGKGTSELTSLVDNVTDMIPGARIAKRAAGFVRDQYVESKEEKRQKKIAKTAGFLKEKDAKEEFEKRKTKKRDDNQKKGTDGILSVGKTLTGIQTFLKGMLDKLMILGMLKTLIGVFTNPVVLIGAAVVAALTTVLTKFDLINTFESIMDYLRDLTAAFKRGMYAIATKFGLEDMLPPEWAPPKVETPPMTDKDYERYAEEDRKAISMIPGINETRSHEEIKTMEALEKVEEIGKVPKVFEKIMTTIGESEVPHEESTESTYTKDELFKFEQEDVNSIRHIAEQGEFDDGYDTKNSLPLIDDEGHLNLHPNLNGDKKIEAANRERYRFSMESSGMTGMLGNEEEFQELQRSADAAKAAEDRKQQGGNLSKTNNITSASNTTINNNSTSNKSFGFSPYDRSSLGTPSRGQIA